MKNLLLILLIWHLPLQAENLLKDVNGDGTIRVLGFGDSITYGVGDGTAPGEPVAVVPFTNGRQGYLSRVSELSGLQVYNGGSPGELLVEGGISRFPSLLDLSGADIVLILEGSNDATLQISTAAYRNALQRIINIAGARSVGVVVGTLPAPCCERVGSKLFTENYSKIVRDRAAINEVVSADVELAWRTTCENKVECELYNLPEGLHPNTRGYRVLAETMLAAIYAVDIFSIGGAATLEQALGLDAGTIITKPVSSQQ